MTTYTPISQLPRPAVGDPPNAPAQLTELTNRLDTLVIPKFASATSRNAAITSPVDGQVAWIGDARTLTAYRADLADWVSYPVYQQGTLVVSGSGNSFTRVVTFAKPFPSVPKVYCNINSSAGPTARAFARATDISSTGFTMFIFYTGDSTTVLSWSSVPVDWTAIY